jgi:integrase
MAKILTPITIRNLRPGTERYEVPDAGCRGLRVVVFPSGCKSFVTRFRYRGLARKLTLGPALIDGTVAEPSVEPQLDTPLTLSAARELCARALRQAKSGVDPTVLKRKQREASTAAQGDTLQAIAEEYLRREGPRLRTLSQREADLELLYEPLGRLPVAEIKRGQYHRVLDRIADTRGPVRADRVLAGVKRLLSWHAERSDFISPLGRGGRRMSPKELARSRVLTDEELRKLWTAAEIYPGPFGAYLCFTMLTATRRGESAGLRRGELSDDGRTWIIPGARYKSKHDTLIPLSETAQKIIAAQPVLGEFVFSADGSRPLGGFDKRKAEFDKVAGVHDYRLHDLRRSSRTLLSRAGIPTDIAERALGHAKAGVRATYDRFEYAAEKRNAFERLAQMIEHIVRPPPVTDLGEARGKRLSPLSKARVLNRL